jgi:hypothetical protein
MAHDLASLTTDLIESYGNTAKNIIAAARAGNERAVKAATSRWEAAVAAAPKLSDEVRGNAVSAQQKIGAYYLHGIALSADGADTAVAKAVEIATKGVQQAAANASAFEKATSISALSKLAEATIPAAEAVSKVVGRLESRSSAFAVYAAGGNIARAAQSARKGGRKVRAAVRKATPA